MYWQCLWHVKGFNDAAKSSNRGDTKSRMLTRDLFVVAELLIRYCASVLWLIDANKDVIYTLYNSYDCRPRKRSFYHSVDDVMKYSRYANNTMGNCV